MHGAARVATGPALALLCACAGPSRRQIPPLPPEPVLYEWHGDALEGPVTITISLSEQIARIRIGGRYAGWMTVATGKPGHRTPTGKFRVTEKLVEKYSSHYGFLVDADGHMVKPDADARRDRPPPGGHFEHAPMHYWMRLTRWGIGMHAGLIPNPGSPASKGCIRMPKAFAPTLFSRVVVGTPVTIVP
jgi:lipoprotein-anchoring transpeptidase ErfK/SrfK